MAYTNDLPPLPVELRLAAVEAAIRVLSDRTNWTGSEADIVAALKAGTLPPMPVERLEDARVRVHAHAYALLGGARA